ncbi:uncharacterized protein LOC107220055 isoform X1 [Neodiprion lecontei]|uniref:Uncharacterized protein LOC107220055 isoform X1 n=1 Tax=Neodiprion lecontei TaxID=441921 RepID=A0A6J0BHK4_NEOLC|nr:uncharacterized protein LOC107220055 isoform X1 [Neodiprion lecontei]
MEQRKPRIRKGGYKPSRQKDEVSKISETGKDSGSKPDQTPVIKKLNPEDYDYTNSDKTQFAHLKRETQEADILNNAPTTNSRTRRKVVSNWKKYEEIPDTEIPTKDFQTLLNVPISEGGHFIFKSEKNWAIEVSKYSDLFSLNVKKLARDINCVPFTEYIDVEDRYFTADQLMKFQNLAEMSRSDAIEVDNNIVQILMDIKRETVAENQDIDSGSEPEVSIEIHEMAQGKETIEEDLDFLLSLKEPVKLDQAKIAPPTYQIKTEEEKIPNSSAPVKSIDLEKWLDSILDS